MQEKDFCKMLDVPSITSPRTLQEIHRLDTNYRPLTKSERDKVMLEVIRTVDSNRLSKTGAVEKWEKCWGDVRDEFIKTGDLSSLHPAFYNKRNICRLWKDYIFASSITFEENVNTILRCWVFDTYLHRDNDVFEFGCGPGHNLILLSEMYPNRKLHGLEWASSAVDIVNLLGEKYNFNMDGQKFDMFNPTDKIGRAHV